MRITSANLTTLPFFGRQGLSNINNFGNVFQFGKELWRFQFLKNSHHSIKEVSIVQKLFLIGLILIYLILLLNISPYLDWIRRDTEYLSVVSPNARKCRPEKLQIQTLFTQWKIFIFSEDDTCFSETCNLRDSS